MALHHATALQEKPFTLGHFLPASGSACFTCAADCMTIIILFLLGQDDHLARLKSHM